MARLLFPVCIVVICLLCGAWASRKDGKMGGKARTLVYRSTPTSLIEQYVTMKDQYMVASREGRELMVLYQSEDKHAPNGHNLCDIFDTPGGIKCDKHMKMKCGNKEKEEGGKPQKKKVVFNCEPSHDFGSVEKVDAASESFHLAFPLKLQNQRVEEVQYVQAMMGVVNKNSKKLADYTVIYWNEGHLHLGHELGVCSVGTASPGSEESSACTDFKRAVAALVQASSPYCTQRPGALRIVRDTSEEQGVHSSGAGACYVAGAARATGQEAAILLDLGLQSFRGLWLQHHGAKQQTPGAGFSQLSASALQEMLVHIAPASAEVMEWGLMVEATTFAALTSEAIQTLTNADAAELDKRRAGGVLVQTGMVEYERARAGRTYCTSHRDRLVPADGATVDPSWCGKIKPAGYAYKSMSVDQYGEDDGPFENATLNAFVVNLALSLMKVFNSRLLQLGLGFLCVVLIFGIGRLCYVRWRRTSTKTF